MSILRTGESADFGEDESEASFQTLHPALFEVLRATQEKLCDIERDNAAFDVAEMELVPRAELDARVRAEQTLAIKLGKEGWAGFLFFCFFFFFFFFSKNFSFSLRIRSAAACSLA